MNLSTIPLDDIKWDHVLALVGQPEAVDLEFKSDLRVKSGGTHPWHQGGELDRVARDSLAAEVVAFANSWGGTVILGADEDRSTPRICSRICPLPRVKVLAEKIEASLRSIIDPPLANLSCKAILSPDEGDAGVVVIRVARSILAPHGYGEPALSYVRRGTTTAPMTMSDLQNAFWDARTRSERISKRREAAEEFLEERVIQFGLFRSIPREGGIFARYSAYPHEPLMLPDLDALELWTKLLRPEENRLFRRDCYAPFGGGLLGWLPEPIAHGIRNLQANSSSGSLWKVGEDGSVEVWGYCAARKIAEQPQPLINPAWMVTAVGQIVAMVEYLRRRAGKPGVPIEIDCSFRGEACVSHARASMFETAGRSLERSDKIEVGPFVLSRSGTAGAVVNAIEREIWRGMGIARIESLDFQPEVALDLLEGVMSRSRA
ncbi:AlbA family DNA-binding domain-containing protein [Bosea sp. (in: a-proteobacteria)]|uniref:AlbA family DNA-binding domain-containing protein n=1 Tax=Bosea sp. (in: a-proteobacteria) TaxID=1871050 RepID=UPI004033F84E